MQPTSRKVCGFLVAASGMAALFGGVAPVAAAVAAPAAGAATVEPAQPPPPPEVNGCGGDGPTSVVPDSYGAANFTPACDQHDICYSVGSPVSRLDCDKRLAVDLANACVAAYPAPGDPNGAACGDRIGGYYAVVRKVGGHWYQGVGDPA